MDFDVWLAYFIACFVLTMTPGPSIFLGMVHSLNYGYKNTVFTALGDISANFVQMMLVVIGLGAIIANSESAFLWIKWIGVAVLLCIGIKTFFSQSKQIEFQTLQEADTSRSKLFFQGFLVAAGNPKGIVFFSAFFPQFIDPTMPLIPQIAIMCPTVMILDFSWVMCYAVFASKLADRFSANPNLLKRVGGGVLIGAGGLLALSRRF